jgi:hypothetical protein
MQSRYTKLLRATLTASLMLVVIAGAAVVGPFEDLQLHLTAATTRLPNDLFAR